MVKAALKPLYIKQEVNKDQYTDINMNISRMMYDRVGDAANLAEQKTREKWQQIASEEVENAVKGLKAESALSSGERGSESNSGSTANGNSDTSKEASPPTTSSS